MAFLSLRDVGLKALAAVLAVLLWFSVAGESVVERGLEIPLEFENVPASLNIAGNPPDSVRVRLRGAAGVVNGLEVGDVVALVDLEDERPGRRLFDLFSGPIQAPPGIEVTQVVPATVTLTLEPVGSPRTVPIVPDIAGQPAEGFTFGRIVTSPPAVDLVGPASRLEQIATALTEPVSVAGATSRVEATVTVGVADPVVRLRTPVSATVVVDIVPAPLERTLHEITVESRGRDGRRAVVAPDRITVSVLGARELIRTLETGSVRAFVDLAGLVPGDYNLPVAVESDVELGVTQIDPPFVRVTLR